MNGQQLKNSILQMAVQGKLVPQDPNDEPASVLIQRIREEKEKLIKEKKIKKEKNPSYIFRGSDNLHYEKIGDAEPVCIEEQLPFEIPDSWQWVRLGTLMSVISDGTHKTPTYVEKGIPFISVDAIVDNKIDFNRKRGDITEEYNNECCKKYRPQLYDVYLVKSGSTVGKVAIVETTNIFNIWSPLAAMRCGDKTYPYFLYYLLQTKDIQAQVIDKASNGI